MKALFWTVLVAMTGSVNSSAFAGEIHSINMESIQSAGVVSVPNGCTIKVEHKVGDIKFWFDTEKTVNCYGVILHNVKGKDSYGNGAAYDEVFVFPASQDQAEAGMIMEALAVGLGVNGAKPREGVEIEISMLKVSDSAILLSEFTKDPADKQSVRPGGLVLKIKSTEGAWTSNRRISMGLN